MKLLPDGHDFSVQHGPDFIVILCSYNSLKPTTIIRFICSSGTFCSLLCGKTVPGGRPIVTLPHHGLSRVTGLLRLQPNDHVKVLFEDSLLVVHSVLNVKAPHMVAL